MHAMNRLKVRRMLFSGVYLMDALCLPRGIRIGWMRVQRRGNRRERFNSMRGQSLGPEREVIAGAGAVAVLRGLFGGFPRLFPTRWVWAI